jgi:hypothetical protein
VALMEGNVTEVILQPSNTASGDDERDEDSG